MCWRQLTVKTYTKALHERSVYDLNTAVADRIVNRVFIHAAAFKRGFRLVLTPDDTCLFSQTLQISYWTYYPPLALFKPYKNRNLFIF